MAMSAFTCGSILSVDMPMCEAEGAETTSRLASSARLGRAAYSGSWYLPGAISTSPSIQA